MGPLRTYTPLNIVKGGVARFAIIGLIVTASPTRAEVVHGYAELWDYWCSIEFTDAIDFSTQEVFSIDFPTDPADKERADLVLQVPRCGGCPPCNLSDISVWPMNATTGRKVPGASLYDLTTAPESPYCCLPRTPQADSTYVLLTADGLYVKLAVRSMGITTSCCSGQAQIEYFVQTDGSREFGTYIPVESSTWGQIKALYR